MKGLPRHLGELRRHTELPRSETLRENPGFDISGVFLHGGVAETGSRRRPQGKESFPGY